MLIVAEALRIFGSLAFALLSVSYHANEPCSSVPLTSMNLSRDLATEG